MQRLFTVVICLVGMMNLFHAQTSPQLVWVADRGEALEGELIFLRLTQVSEGPQEWKIDKYALEYIESYLVDEGFEFVKIPQTLFPPQPKEKTVWWEGYVYHVKAGQYRVGLGLNVSLESIEDTEEKIEVETSPIALRVKAIPPTQLPNAQCVGDFMLSYGFSKGKEKTSTGTPTYLTGELFYLAIRVEGKGNVTLAPAPFIQFSDSFLLSEPVSQIEWQRKEGELWGQKTFRYELQAAFRNDYLLGPAQMFYFSPSEAKYDSLQTPTLPVKVIGKDIPQLLKVNQLNRFYQQKIKTGTTTPPFRIPYVDVILWICLGIALLLLLWGFIQELIHSRRSGL
ncbi:MAG: hypothetical protein AAF135_24025 [Bacteroidota bacterium]